MAKTIKTNPTLVARPQDNDSDRVKQFNEAVIKDIENLPQELRTIVETQPWYETSEIIIEYIDLLVEELVQLIYNITTLSSGDLGQTIITLCRQLDMMNYQLFRGNYLVQEITRQNEMLHDDMVNNLSKELKEMSKKEARKYIEGNPALEYLVKAESAGKYKCDTANASIDYGLAEIVKVLALL